MAKNIIYYGPPGTGKTYHMQKLISDYTDYKITDDEIIKAYTNYSQDWLLFALIILQSNTTMTTEEIINKVKGVTIGEHSWICKNVTILKNSFVPKHSIVGCGAVFSGGGQSHCVFVGNPARVVKENVEWDANGREYGYIDNE